MSVDASEARDYDATERVERLLALALEHPEASTPEIKRAEKIDRTGFEASRRNASASIRVRGEHLSSADWRPFAREYFKQNEKPDMSGIDVEVRGTDLDELVGGAV